MRERHGRDETDIGDFGGKMNGSEALLEEEVVR